MVRKCLSLSLTVYIYWVLALSFYWQNIIFTGSSWPILGGKPALLHPSADTSINHLLSFNEIGYQKVWENNSEASDLELSFVFHYFGNNLLSSSWSPLCQYNFILPGWWVQIGHLLRLKVDSLQGLWVEYAGEQPSLKLVQWSNISVPKRGK